MDRWTRMEKVLYFFKLAIINYKTEFIECSEFIIMLSYHIIKLELNHFFNNIKIFLKLLIRSSSINYH